MQPDIQQGMEDFKGMEQPPQAYVQPPMQQQQPPQAYVQPPMMQQPVIMQQPIPQQQYYPPQQFQPPQQFVSQPMQQPLMQSQVVNQGGSPQQQPYVVHRPQGYSAGPTPPAIKSAVLSAGVMFLVASIISTILIFLAMCIGWIPWFNYPFDILVVIVSCCVGPPVLRAMQAIQVRNVQGQFSSQYMIVGISGIVHLLVLVGECINLIVSICPYAFYFIDSILLFVLFVEFVLALVCMIASMM